MIEGKIFIADMRMGTAIDFWRSSEQGVNIASRLREGQQTEERQEDKRTREQAHGQNGRVVLYGNEKLQKRKPMS